MLGVVRAEQNWVDRGWADAAPGMALVLELAQVHHVLIERIQEILRPFDITFARFEVLRALSFRPAGRDTISALGDCLQVHSTSVSSAVDLLEKQGLARRVEHDRDRRRVYVVITAQGKARVDEATAVLTERLFADLGLSKRQMVQLWAVLRSFRLNSGDFTPNVDGGGGFVRASRPRAS